MSTDSAAASQAASTVGSAASTSTQPSNSNSTSNADGTHTTTNNNSTTPAPATNNDTTTSLEALGVSITADLLPVIDPDGALEQCGDWSFVVELLNDLLTEKPDILNGLSSALAASDHVAFHKTAHALKGAALNLHLPALSDVSKKAELLGKALEKTPSDAVMLPHRAVLLHRLQSEYARLEAMLPELQLKAQQEQAELAAAGALE